MVDLKEFEHESSRLKGSWNENFYWTGHGI